MIYYGEINYIKKTISIEKKPSYVYTELKKNTVEINKIVKEWSIEKKIKNISIDRLKYRVISIRVPFFSDWVILQNDYLPTEGEYFLN